MNEENKQIIKKNNKNVMTAEKIDEYIKTFLTHKNLLPHEISQFREVALTLNLNPLRGDLHVVAYGQGDNRSLSLITGYLVYLRKADEFPQYEGFETEIIGKKGEHDYRCKITIHRKDRKYPTIHETYFDEVVGRKKDGGLTKFWIKQPRFQLKKCNMAQGFRIAFPNELKDMPYVDAELENNFRDVSDDYESPTEKEVDETVKTLETVKEKLKKDEKTKIPPSQQPKKEAIPEKENKTIWEKAPEQMGKIKNTPPPEKEKLDSKEIPFNPAIKKEEILERARNIFYHLEEEKIKHYKPELEHYGDLKNLPDEKYTIEYHTKELKKMEGLEDVLIKKEPHEGQ